jgi:hypothetical protein
VRPTGRWRRGRRSAADCFASPLACLRYGGVAELTVRRVDSGYFVRPAGRPEQAVPGWNRASATWRHSGLSASDRGFPALASLFASGTVLRSPGSSGAWAARVAARVVAGWAACGSTPACSTPGSPYETLIANIIKKHQRFLFSHKIGVTCRFVIDSRQCQQAADPRGIHEVHRRSRFFRWSRSAPMSARAPQGRRSARCSEPSSPRSVTSPATAWGAAP